MTPTKTEKPGVVFIVTSREGDKITGFRVYESAARALACESEFHNIPTDNLAEFETLLCVGARYPLDEKHSLQMFTKTLL